MKRSILTSLMIIGLVGAVAGGSTLALFSDEEVSEDNTFATGELDLKIDWEESYNGETVDKQNLTDNPDTIFELNDIKPGDHGEATISLHLTDNPGWIWMSMNQTANLENGCTEPESKVDETCGNPGQGEGELGDHLMFTVWSDDGDNELEDGEHVLFNGTAHELSELDSSEKGLLLDGNPLTNQTEAFESEETSYIGVKWHVPLDTGNEIQGDSKKFDIGFYTEQERHNPQEPTEPEEPEEPEPPQNDTNDNETAGNETPEDLKAISFVSFCVEGQDQDNNGTGEQTPSEPCLNGEDQLVKFEWTGNSLVPEGGDAMNISINATDFKDNDPTEPIEANWTSNTTVETAVVKSAQEICNYPGGTQGTVESCTD